MSTKTENKKMIIYEINDDDHKNEYYGHTYIASFFEFIKSLGDWDIVQDHPTAEKIKIDDVDFYINYKHASYHSKSAYDTDWKVRKPENRFMALENGSYNSPTVFKVHFNKEIDMIKLRKKINDRIQSVKDSIKWNDDRKEADKNNTIAIALHYISESKLDVYNIQPHLYSIKIHKGLIIFSINKVGTLSINLKNEFQQFTVTGIDVDNVKKIEQMYNQIGRIPVILSDILNCIDFRGPIDQNLVEWATDAYERRFDVPEMKYSSYN